MIEEKYYCDKCSKQIQNYSMLHQVDFGYTRYPDSINRDYCGKCYREILEFAGVKLEKEQKSWIKDYLFPKVKK